MKAAALKFPPICVDPAHRTTWRSYSSQICACSVKGSLSGHPPPSPLGRSLPLTQNNASGCLRSISMTKVTRDKPPSSLPFIKPGKQSLHLPTQAEASGPFTRRRGGGTQCEKAKKKHQHAGMRFLILCDARRLLTFERDADYCCFLTSPFSCDTQDDFKLTGTPLNQHEGLAVLLFSLPHSSPSVSQTPLLALDTDGWTSRTRRTHSAGSSPYKMHFWPPDVNTAKGHASGVQGDSLRYIQEVWFWFYVDLYQAWVCPVWTSLVLQ